jgi:hypothetical protein
MMASHTQVYPHLPDFDRRMTSPAFSLDLRAHLHALGGESGVPDRVEACRRVRSASLNDGFPLRSCSNRYHRQSRPRLRSPLRPTLTSWAARRMDEQLPQEYDCRANLGDWPVEAYL